MNSLVSKEYWDLLVNKKVVLRINGESKLVKKYGREIEGTVVLSNPELGFLIKQKSSVTALLVDQEYIIVVLLCDAKEHEPIKVKLQPVQFGFTRKHLVERHGYSLLDTMNLLGEQEAYISHNVSSHELLHRDYGHFHEELNTSAVVRKLGLTQK